MANLKKRSIYGELDYFLEAGDDTLEGDGLVDEVIRDLFTLLWEAIELLAVEALPCFWKWDSRASFSAYLV